MIALRPWTIKRGKTNQFQLVNDPNPPFHTFLHPVSSSLLGPTNISTPTSLFPAPPHQRINCCTGKFSKLCNYKDVMSCNQINAKFDSIRATVLEIGWDLLSFLTGCQSWGHEKCHLCLNIRCMTFLWKGGCDGHD